MNKSVDDEHLPIAAAVIVDDGRVLLVRRRVYEGRLSWQFPAGKVEPGESPDAAAVREPLKKRALSYERSTGLVNGCIL
ncbi:NUDIX hydrolase [Paractinoplanes rishiriensis]|uniref:Nudix hydrolase domain-containing protein n=1 Tax=Paractinoplanes rishiriensis TaxID=1050105 RepID=A0A919KAB4_9ACTN|nr:NUDIX hydrolase [Actinoplanes rishiriensis]GIF01786.1 hypothetical protein Ari01nite_92500 [Actinoplanes rishiriensis]